MMSDVEIEVVQGEEQFEGEELLEILDEAQLKEAVDYLKKEYSQATSEMDQRNKKLIKWRKNMEAVASDAPRSTPFKNSSNVTVPVTQTITQSLYAQVKGTFTARKPLWSIETYNKNDEVIQRNKVVEKYLGILAESPYDLDMANVLNDLIFEAMLAGGCFPKVTYGVESWKVKNASGGEEKEVVWHDGPKVTVAPLERVKYRRGVSEISRLPWIAIDYPMTKTELQERAAKGIYDPDAVELVLSEERTTPTETEEQEQIAEAYSSGETTGLFDISEVYFYFDVDGSGVPVDLLFTIHMGTGAVLKQQYNSLGARSIVSAKYIHRPSALTGRGTGQMTESMQDEVTGLHNMRNDNVKVAGMRMIAVRKGSGFGAKREVFPGCVWEVENPADDVRPIQLGEVYPSSLASENQGWSIAQRAVGVSESQMGFADTTLGSRDTARGQMMRVQRGDTILGSVVDGLRNTLSQIGMLVWMQCVANRERVIAREKAAERLNEEELGSLEEALKMEISEVPLKMNFIVKTTEAERTYEQQRMNVMTLSQLFAQYAEKTVPLAMQLYSPQGLQMQQQAPELYNYLGRLLAGSGKLMESIFEFFGVYDTANYVPDPDRLDEMLDMMRGAAQSLQGMPQIAGGANGEAAVQAGPAAGVMPAEGMATGETGQMY
jgi:hypothetical protein